MHQLTYRIVERDAVLLEERYCDVMSPCRRVTWSSKEHCVPQTQPHMHILLYIIIQFHHKLPSICRAMETADNHSVTKARFPLSEFTGRVDGPWTRVHFLTPKLTARVDGCQKCTRVDEPSTWVHFLTPVNSGRQLGCQLGPSTRPVNLGRSGNRALVTQWNSGQSPSH